MDMDLSAVLSGHAQWLTGTGGTRANLTGANLHRADLAWADLAWARLTGANLHGADLANARLTGANLDGADLHGADLHGADLTKANLHGANLAKADLYGAALDGADLAGANLESARLPVGVGWWQGGAYGPRRRMVRALVVDGTITVMAGCLSGPPDKVLGRLRDERVRVWVVELGADGAAREMDQVAELIHLAVATLTPTRSDGR